MPAEFDKWWNDTKKHYKRLHYWLPPAKELKLLVGNTRPFRYFTLCARSMIDIFMLAKEGILTYDDVQGIVTDVRFCELDNEQFPEIKELVGAENSGFFGKLEDLVLFQEDNFTAQYPTLDSIEEALENEGLTSENREHLQTKRIHIYLKSSFPYDFINLDFCGYYYPNPPEILKINQTVERFLYWQRTPGPSEAPKKRKITANTFLLSVTCRYDNEFPHDAETRLANLVRSNCRIHSAYKDYLENKRGITNLDAWIESMRDDFFLSTWPKEVSALAEQYQWDMEVIGYLNYDRLSDENRPYKIICLMCRFNRESDDPNYLQVAIDALDQSKRKLILDITRDSQQGKYLLKNLSKIAKLRNQQAERKHRPLLPDP